MKRYYDYFRIIRYINISGSRQFWSIQAVTLILFLVFSTQIFGQNVEVRRLDEYFESLKTIKSDEAVSEGNRLHSLVYDLHSTLFVSDSNITNPMGGRPVSLIIDAASIKN